MSIFSRGERLWLFALSAVFFALFAARSWISAGLSPTRLLDTSVYAVAAADDFVAGDSTANDSTEIDSIHSITNAPATGDAFNDGVTDPFPIDVNRADQETLTLLPGIGPVIAERIVAYRTQHGLFQSVEELLHVKGIGPARLARLLELVTIKQPDPE